MMMLFIGSCVPSLHPLYTQDDLIFEEKIIGTWIDEENDSIVWEFEKYHPSTIFPSQAEETKGDFYKLTVKGEKPAVFHVHLIKLGKYLYFDFYLKNYEFDNDMAELHLFPVHNFAKVRYNEDSIAIEHFNRGFIEDMIKENKARIKHEVSYGNLILTAGTEELQKFVIKYADNDELYASEPTILKRKN
jgi:hypothetical protein